MSLSRRFRGMPVVVAGFVTCLVVLAAAPVRAAVVPELSAADLATAVVRDAAQVSSASVARPILNAPTTGVGDSPLSTFPSDGSTFAVLSTGNADDADLPNANFPDGLGANSLPDPGERSTSFSTTASPGRGNAFDVTTLQLNLNLVATAGQNCLLLDFAFYSEEFVEFVGTTFNDAFLAQLDTNSFFVDNAGVITAPGNFAFDPNAPGSKPVSVNASGPLTMSAALAAGTTYDGATPKLQAATPAAPGTHSLFLTVFDAADSIFDSAAFIDDVRWIRVANPGTDCQPGAVPFDPNEPPVAEANGPYTVDEGSAIALSSAGSADPELEPLTYEWALDPAVDATLDDATIASPMLTGVDDSSGPVTLTVFDELGVSGTDTAGVTVANVPPEIDSIDVPAAPLLSTQAVQVTAQFSDPGTADTHTYSIDFGDGGLPSTGPASGGTASASRVLAPGAYLITVTITDDDDGSDTETATQMVIVDAGTPGSATGGGWIHSPAGSVTAQPDAAGKANVGFVVREPKKSPVPTGNTRFNFREGRTNFKSTGYLSLAFPAANEARYKGEGTINGRGNYEFKVSLIEGHVAGGDGIDRFRIRIWSGTGTVYDSQPGDAPSDPASTPLSGGSIVIHPRPT